VEFHVKIPNCGLENGKSLRGLLFLLQSVVLTNAIIKSDELHVFKCIIIQLTPSKLQYFTCKTSVRFEERQKFKLASHKMRLTSAARSAVQCAKRVGHA